MWVSPQFEIVSSDIVRKLKNEKKVNFCWDLEGKGGRRERDALWCTFCVCKLNLFSTPHFFHFGINIGFIIPKEEFGKDKLHVGIKFIF